MKKLGLIVIVSGLFDVGSVFGQGFTLKSDDLSGQLTEMSFLSKYCRCQSGM
jgi:hypothetical protein